MTEDHHGQTNPPVAGFISANAINNNPSIEASIAPQETPDSGDCPVTVTRMVSLALVSIESVTVSRT